MATQNVNLSTSSIGLIGVTQTAALAAADVAAINQAIVDDQMVKNTWSQNTQTSVGTAFSSTNVSTLSSVQISGLTSVQVGYFISGNGIPPGTQILSISGTSPNATITMSNASTAGQSAGAIMCSPRPYPGGYVQNGFLSIPNRGTLKVLPGDVVAVDPLTGWPILISAAAVGAAGSNFKVT